MGYAVEIIFDSKSEEQIHKLIESIDANGIENKLTNLKSTPHMALSVADEIDVEKTIKLIENIAIPSLRISMNALGTFQGAENVIFLNPKVTMDLLAFQKELYNQLFTFSEQWVYYHPENWIPHCTLAMGIAEEEFLNAFQVLRKNMQYISARVEKIRLIKFHPEELIYERIAKH
ncbi:2'-5' RNA ligase family protein [Marinifilum sp. D737]|uniref:2'-5' RNA ligase family protein n=1 Tax=Marinifilum sp. D737 TaxID=2969628 RepID=UPI0022741671|nr:2'-5' RNA ligase family protein [Marinifilum sp. D737]MCY1635510.1 2'-5' RNA ligase family protein [Marinifilum sp. D737]